MSEKRITLNQTWKNCLRMWKWIDKEYICGMDVEVMKCDWLDKYKPDLCHASNCFFCQYASEHNKEGDVLCVNCPGRLVSKFFNCTNKSYHYLRHPKKFYKKLLELDAKRKVKK